MTASNVEYGNKENSAQTKDGQTFGVGGWYAVLPSTKIYAAAQYQKHWDTAAGLSTKDLTAAGLTNGDELRAGGFDGYSLDKSMTNGSLIIAICSAMGFAASRVAYEMRRSSRRAFDVSP